MKYKMEENKKIQDFLEYQKSKKEIDDYIENEDNTISIVLDNYEAIISLDDYSILKITKYDNNKSRIIGEFYTTSTGATTASIRIKLYEENIDQNFPCYNVVNKKEFSNFFVFYHSRWQIYSTSENLIFYSVTDSIENAVHNVSWNYKENVHYYICIKEKKVTKPSIYEPIARISTSSTKDSLAVVNVEEYNPDIVVTKVGHYDALDNAQEFTNFSISYSYPNWTVTALTDKVYYATSSNTPLSEYKKLDSINWSYKTVMTYYIIIK